MAAERAHDAIDDLQQLEDRLILFPTLRYSSPFSSAAGWQKAVGRIVDGGTVDFIATASVFRKDPEDFVHTIECSLVEGANRIIRRATAKELEGTLGSSVGDALVATLEIGQWHQSSAESSAHHQVFAAITREKDYSTMTREGADEGVKKSLIVWRQVLEALDRKANRDQRSLDDIKSIITSRVISQLGYVWHTSKNKNTPEAHPIDVWRRNLFLGDRSAWYSGVFRFLSESAQARDGKNGATQSMIADHPEWYAKPLLNIARDAARHLGSEKALTIALEVMMDVISTYHMVEAESVYENELIRCFGLDVGNAQEEDSAEYLTGLIPYVQGRLKDMSDWENIPDAEVFVLAYMGRMLDSLVTREREAMDRLVQCGLFGKKRPLAVRLMAFHLVLSAREALGYSVPYQQMIHSVLFAPTTYESRQFWREAMRISNIKHASDLAAEALKTDPFNGDERGIQVFNLFMSLKYDAFLDALAASEGSPQNVAVNGLIHEVEAMRGSLEGVGMGLSHFDRAISLYKEFKELLLRI